MPDAPPEPHRLSGVGEVDPVASGTLSETAGQSSEEQGRSGAEDPQPEALDVVAAQIVPEADKAWVLPREDGDGGRDPRHYRLRRTGSA